MAGRPPINLHGKIRELLTHTMPQQGIDAPLLNFEERANASLNLIKYIDDHISTQSVYQAVYERHMALQHRMVLVSLIEAFERFIKETAVVCVDAVAPHTFDDRFNKFKAAGGNLASQFNAGSIGKAMCESDTWLDNKAINERFQQLLKPHFGSPWEHLFPNEKQQPAAEQDRARSLAILWQIRHNITHNTGLLTDSDARRLTLMVKTQVPSGEAINPSVQDLRYVKRFLVETARNSNKRIGIRLATLLTERHTDDSSLFSTKDIADQISVKFQTALTVNGTIGAF